MKINILLYLFICVYGVYSQQDTCIDKRNLIKYANKIYNLRTENDYLAKKKTNDSLMISTLDSIVIIQKSKLDISDAIILNCEQQILLRDSIITLKDEKIDILTPKWYDNKFMWFSGGVLVGILIIL